MEQIAAQKATEALNAAIVSVVMVHLATPDREKIYQAIDALALAVGMTIGGIGNEQHKLRVYFNQRLSESIAKAKDLDIRQ